MMRKLEFGDMVVDNYGRTCMVIEEIDCPSQAWLDVQDDKTTRFAINCRWLKLFPMTGGDVHAPETHIKRLGNRAGEADLMELYENANGFAKESIMKKLVEKAFKEKERRKEE